MKKIKLMLLIGAMGWATAVDAQLAIVRIDSVFEPYIQFDYQSWMDADTHNAIIAAYYYFYMHKKPNDTMPPLAFCGDMMQYNYIEGGADVYGITVWGKPQPVSPIDRPFFPTEYLYLYDATPDSLVELVKMPFNFIDTFVVEDGRLWPSQISPRPSLSTNCSDVTRNQPQPRYSRYDYYFNKPIHVKDSFYVGASQHIPIGLQLYFYYQFIGEDVPGATSPWYLTLRTWSSGTEYDSTCWPPPMKAKFRWEMDTNAPYIDWINPIYRTPTEEYVLNEWVDLEERDFYLILPIIKAYDTLTTDDLPECREVTWFVMRDDLRDTVELRWQAADEHAEWQISYGPKGIDPDDGTLATCHETRWVCTDTTHRGDTMVAWVRTVCRDEDYLRYSEWSYPLEWCMGNANNEGIELPGGSAVVDGMVQLSPNPARGEVTVRSSYLLKGLEVFTQRGELYRTLDASGLQSTFSVQGWPKGSYIVAVHTAAGTTTKKLIVQP